MIGFTVIAGCSGQIIDTFLVCCFFQCWPKVGAVKPWPALRDAADDEVIAGVAENAYFHPIITIRQ